MRLLAVSNKFYKTNSYTVKKEFPIFFVFYIVLQNQHNSLMY